MLKKLEVYEPVSVGFQNENPSITALGDVMRSIDCHDSREARHIPKV